MADVQSLQTSALPPTKPAVVITGATSGIGRAFARIAAAEGEFIILIGRSQPALAAVVAEITANGGSADTIAADLQQPGAAAQIEEALSQRGLHCRVLVNSAGYGLFGPATKLDRASQVGIVDVNARALTDITLRLLPDMVRRREGGVIIVGSVAGYFAGPNMAVYYASKAYVRSFAAALAAELTGTGVTVTCVSPGPVRTRFLQRAGATNARLFKLLPRSSAHTVALAGWNAFKAGRSLVIPGWANRLLVIGARLLPSRLMVKLAGSLQRSG